jgi:hypothetical protein
LSGTAKLLAEDIAAAKYLLKMIDRSSTVPEWNPVATRDRWKVLLLDDFHLGCLKDFLLCGMKSELNHLSWARSIRNKRKRMISIRTTIAMVGKVILTC